jgi:hypothetical protein
MWFMAVSLALWPLSMDVGRCSHTPHAIKENNLPRRHPNEQNPFKRGLTPPEMAGYPQSVLTPHQWKPL